MKEVKNPFYLKIFYQLNTLSEERGAFSCTMVHSAHCTGNKSAGVMCINVIMKRLGRIPVALMGGGGGTRVGGDFRCGIFEFIFFFMLQKYVIKFDCTV